MICDKFKDSLPQYLREQVRIAENGKWKETTEFAEILDKYVSERSDFTSFSKPWGNKWKENNNNKTLTLTTPNTIEEAASPIENEINNSWPQNTNTQHDVTKGPIRREDNSAGDTLLKRCQFCLQTNPWHSPQKCYKNPSNIETRLKVGRISTQYDEMHWPSIKLGDELDSGNNSSRGFAEASQCVNNRNFEIGSLFTEVQNVGVSIPLRIRRQTTR